MAKRPNGPTLQYSVVANGRVLYEGVGNHYRSMIEAVEPTLRRGVEVDVLAEDRQTAFNVKSALIIHKKHAKWGNDYKAGWRSHQDRGDAREFKIRWTPPKKDLKKKPEPKSETVFVVTKAEEDFLRTSLAGLRSM
jgi:hypothetical protein